MQQRITLITLGVASLERARAFYEGGLGWRPAEPVPEGVVFYPLGGFALGLFGREALAEDARMPLGQGFGGVTLAHNVESREAVDALLGEAVRAGATLLKPGEDVFWGGYSGYFADPDGHVWEVAWNPGWELTPDGRLASL